MARPVPFLASFRNLVDPIARDLIISPGPLHPLPQAWGSHGLSQPGLGCEASAFLGKTAQCPGWGSAVNLLNPHAGT